MCFGGDYRSKEPFSLYQGFILITVDVDHDHVDEVVLDSSLHSKVTFSFHSVLFGKKSLYAVHTEGDAPWGCNIYINYLKLFCLSDFSFLPHSLIYSIIYISKDSWIFCTLLWPQLYLLLNFVPCLAICATSVGYVSFWHAHITVVSFSQDFLVYLLPQLQNQPFL